MVKGPELNMLRAIVLFILPLILCVPAQYRQYNADNRVKYDGKSEIKYDATNSQPMYQPRSYIKLPARTWSTQSTEAPIPAPAPAPIQTLSYGPVQVAPKPRIDSPPAPLANSSHPLEHLSPLLPKPESDRRPVFIKHSQPTPVQIETKPSPVKVPVQARPTYVPTQSPTLAKRVSLPILRPGSAIQPFVRPTQPVSRPTPRPWPQPIRPIINNIPRSQPPALPPQIIPNLQKLPSHDNASIIYVMYGQPPATATTQRPVEIVTEPSPVIVQTQTPPVYVPTQPPAPAPKHLLTASRPIIRPLPTRPVQPIPRPNRRPLPTRPVQPVSRPIPSPLPTRPVQPAPRPIPKSLPTRPVQPIPQPIPSPWQRPKQPIIQHIPGPISPTLPTPVDSSIQGLPCHDNASIIYVMYGQPPATATTQRPVEIVTESSPVIVQTQTPPVYVPTQPPAPAPTPKHLLTASRPIIRPLPTRPVQPIPRPNPRPLRTRPVQPVSRPIPSPLPTRPVQPIPRPNPRPLPTRPVQPIPQPIPSPWQRPKQPIIQHIPGPISPTLPTPVDSSIQGLPCHDNASIIYVMYGQPPATATTQRPVEIVTESSPVIVQTQTPPVYVPTQPPAPAPTPKHLVTASRPIIRPLPTRPVQPVSRPISRPLPTRPAQPAPRPLVIAPPRPGKTVLHPPSCEPTQATPTQGPAHVTSSVPSRPTGSSKLNFSCPDDYGFYAIDKECDAYIQCENRIATMQNCPDGLHFNSAAKWNEQPCGYPALVKCAAGSDEQSPLATAQCPRQNGFFSMNNGDCSKYIVCYEGIASIMNCPAGLVFNTAIDDCDWPESVPECNPKVLSDYTCPEAPLDANGAVSDVVYKYRYENQCKFFVACHKGFPRLLSCDPGLAFDEASQSCIADAQAADCNTPTLYKNSSGTALKKTK